MTHLAAAGEQETCAGLQRSATHARLLFSARLLCPSINSLTRFDL